MKCIKMLGLLLVLFCLEGCATQVQNITNQTVPVAANNLSTVTQAILTAAHEQGWATQVLKQTPSIGLIKLAKSDGNRSATVEIPYTHTSYSIIRRMSMGFDYDPQTNTIDSAYNDWVNDLNTRLQYYVVNGVPQTTLASKAGGKTAFTSL